MCTGFSSLSDREIGAGEEQLWSVRLCGVLVERQDVRLELAVVAVKSRPVRLTTPRFEPGWGSNVAD